MLFMQIRGSHLGCERLVIMISCKSLPRTWLLLFKLVKLPPESGIYHLFTLKISNLTCHPMLQYMQISCGHLRSESVALLICKKWHRKWVPCFKLLQESDITLQFSLPGSKLTFHPCALICKLGAGILDLTVAMATCKTSIVSKLLDPNYINYCGIHHPFTIQISYVTIHLMLQICKWEAAILDLDISLHDYVCICMRYDFLGWNYLKKEILLIILIFLKRNLR